jgi:hypothetical protein
VKLPLAATRCHSAPLARRHPGRGVLTLECDGGRGVATLPLTVGMVDRSVRCRECERDGGPHDQRARGGTPEEQEWSAEQGIPQEDVAIFQQHDLERGDGEQRYQPTEVERHAAPASRRRAVEEHGEADTEEEREEREERPFGDDRHQAGGGAIGP